MLAFIPILSESRLCLAQGRTITSTCARYFAKKTGSNPCADKKSKTEVCVDNHPKPRSAKDIKKTFPFYDLIKYNLDCCLGDCSTFEFPSFDKCLYKESDKNKRKYQVTWVECPPIVIKPKKICCSSRAKRPPIVRREKHDRPETACKKKVCPAAASSCPRIRMPRCRSGQIPPKCYVNRDPSDCVKIKAPYPAFSECSRKPLRKKRTIECGCLDHVMMCEVYAHLNKNRQRGITDLNPCGKR